MRTQDIFLTSIDRSSSEIQQVKELKIHSWTTALNIEYQVRIMQNMGFQSRIPMERITTFLQIIDKDK